MASGMSERLRILRGPRLACEMYNAICPSSSSGITTTMLLNKLAEHAVAIETPLVLRGLTSCMPGHTGQAVRTTFHTI